MRRSYYIRGSIGAVALALMASFSSAPAASAYVTDDGPPDVNNSVAPESGPTAGGQPVRIRGAGFDGTTAVKFGGVNATSFHVVDSKLITAVTPAASVSNNTSVDVTVTDPDGTGTGTNTGDTTGYYYSNATETVPASVSAGSRYSVSISGYAASTGVIIPEFNPLLIYLEGGPDFPPGSPPYAALLGSGTTSTSGGLTQTVTIPRSFSGTSGSSYDPNVACPVNNAPSAPVTVNYLGNSAPSGSTPAYSGKCMIAFGQSGAATLEAPITYSSPTEPTPASPVLNLDSTTVSRGGTINVAAGSKYWNANPFFGSSTSHSLPGETNLTIQVCWGTNNATCSTTTGTGAVSLTRYTTTSTTTPIVGVFSGTDLTGSVTVGADVPSGSAVVKVTQYRPGGTQSISQTTSITVS